MAANTVPISDQVSKEDTLPMGFSFMLNRDTTEEYRTQLREAYLYNNLESSPSPTRIRLTTDMLTLQRENHESASSLMPVDVPDFGRLFSGTATLMERPLPYFFGIEMARGKINQVRNQMAEWESAGLRRTPELDWDLRQAVRALSQALIEPMSAESEYHSKNSLGLAFQAAEALIAEYIRQIFELRHSRQPRLDTHFGCWLNETPSFEHWDTLSNTFNAMRIPISWRAIEPTEANYHWNNLDDRIRWANERGFHVSLGPVIDFSPEFFPEWMETWNGDLTALGSFICDFLETTIARYKGKVNQWLLCTRSNCSTCLGISEEDQIRLTARLLDAATQIDPAGKFFLGISHPWGSYLGRPGFNYTPGIFADTLLRAGLPVAGYEVEWLMGSSPRGDFVRDRLEASRILDMYGMLGVPISVSLAYPSSAGTDELAAPGERVSRCGYWKNFDPAAQADWCRRFTELAVSKPFVTSVFWDSWSDLAPHRIPNSGLVGADGQLKPAIAHLEELRVTHLK